MQGLTRLLVLASSILFLGTVARATDDGLNRTGAFAGAKDVFRPLIADPREPQMGIRWIAPVSHKNLAEVQFGEYFGFYRWKLGQDSYLQWSFGGGLFSRFDLASDQKGLLVMDFLAEMPVDLRFGRWTFRIMPYHISSHLGDDYINETGIMPEKYAFDSLKGIAAYEFPQWRLYAGYGYILRHTNVYKGNNALQGGFEWTSRYIASGRARFFWANDLQAWERVKYNPQYVTQVGIHFARDPYDKQILSLYTEYADGHSTYGQLFQNKETHWGAGLRFYLS